MTIDTPPVESMTREQLEAEVTRFRQEQEPPPPAKPRCIKPCFPVGCQLDEGHDGKCLPYPTVPAGGRRFA